MATNPDRYIVEYRNPETGEWEVVVSFPHTSKGWHKAKVAALELKAQGFEYRFGGTL